MANYQPVREASYSVQTLNNTEELKLISGTYCHPLLIPHIAFWISPTFALKAASIINFYIVEQYRSQLQACELANNERTQLLEQKNQELEQEKAALQAAIQDCKPLEVTEEPARNLEEPVAKKSRKKQKWASTHAFAFLELSAVFDACRYYAIECQRNSMSTAIRRLRKRHPEAEVKYYQNQVPNDVKILKRLKDTVKFVKRNYTLLHRSEEEIVIRKIIELSGTTNAPCNVAPLNAHRKVSN
jgi:hypothetical protein